ncbi:MAG: hypothetical protein ABIF92_02480, partial [archaeon]
VYGVELPALKNPEEYVFENVYVQKPGRSVFLRMMGITDDDRDKKTREIAEFYVKHAPETSLVAADGATQLNDFGVVGVSRRLQDSANIIIEERKKEKEVGYIVGQEENSEKMRMLWPVLSSKERGEGRSAYIILALLKFAKDKDYRKIKAVLRDTLSGDAGLSRAQKRYNAWREKYITKMFEKVFKLEKTREADSIYYEFDLALLPEIKEKTKKWKRQPSIDDYR